MQSQGEIDGKGEKAVGVTAPKDSPTSIDSVSLEAADEDAETKALTRKLLLKLDTRCVFSRGRPPLPPVPSLLDHI